MKSRTPIVPTLLTRPTRACPRCDRPRLRPLAVNRFGSFAWHECEDCLYLWAVPHGWAVHSSLLPKAAE